MSAPIVRLRGAVQASPDGGLDEGRVGLAARRLHDLADEEPDGLRLARRGSRRRPPGSRRGPSSIERVEGARRRRSGEAALGDDRGGRLARSSTCASRTSRPLAREIEPVVRRPRRSPRARPGRRRPGPDAALRSCRYSPVTQFATGLARQVRAGREGRLEQRASHPGSATSTAASYGDRPSDVAIARRAGRAGSSGSAAASSVSQAGSRCSGGRSGSGK